MASALTSDKLQSGLIVRQAIGGDLSSAAAVPQSKDNDETWMDMADLESLLIIVLLSTRVANIASFTIEASAAANGGTPSTIKTHATPTTANAAGDYRVLEVKAEELEDVLAGLRYVAAKVGCANSGDRVIVTYIGIPKVKRSDNTVDYTS